MAGRPAHRGDPELEVRGGPGLVGGDGLELRGRTLYDVRGSAPTEVSVLQLSRRRHGWVATWRGALTDETLDVPSTATWAAGSLWAVNARFGVAFARHGALLDHPALDPLASTPDFGCHAVLPRGSRSPA